MKPDLDTLIEFITDNYPFTEETHAELKGLPEDVQLKFAINHLALHFSKTAGKIATVSEEANHSGDINIEALRTDIPKALINTLRLAKLIDMKGEEIVAALEEMYGQKISK